MTIKDIQRICQIGRTTAYSLVAENRLKAIRINRALRVRQSDLEQYLRDREYFTEEQR